MPELKKADISKIYKNPDGVKLAFGIIDSLLLVVQSQLKLVLAEGNEHNIVSMIRQATELQDSVADEIEFLQTGIDAGVRRSEEAAQLRAAIRNVIPAGASVVRKGAIRRGDQVLDPSSAQIRYATPDEIDADVQAIHPLEVYRKRNG